MKNHVLRPLLVVIGVVIILLLVQHFYVPKDFGVHEQGYTYGWYREGNIEDWKKVTVKYQGSASCKACHQDVFDKMASYPHVIIQCENCHGPALKHPTSPPKLVIDTTRALCLRCHTKLQYPTSGRAAITGIDPRLTTPVLNAPSATTRTDPVCSFCASALRTLRSSRTEGMTTARAVIRTSSTRLAGIRIRTRPSSARPAMAPRPDIRSTRRRSRSTRHGSYA